MKNILTEIQSPKLTEFKLIYVAFQAGAGFQQPALTEIFCSVQSGLTEFKLVYFLQWRLSGLMLMSVHLHLLVKTRGCSLMVVFGLGSSTSTWS